MARTGLPIGIALVSEQLCSTGSACQSATVLWPPDASTNTEAQATDIRLTARYPSLESFQAAQCRDAPYPVDCVLLDIRPAPHRTLHALADLSLTVPVLALG